ncbi:MAG: lipid IV(A) 3-deoxy-D-manno-octulosonic acid transferase [Sulfurimonas sp.]|uniref:lipid IV(A) 3-deoxy-D-manno-octulosonic acid transferase n=1 Tax=Sulfurimonas sp. TaxID=2022749 RepID=UPI00263438B5|nr:lipid IV(A) 3-deoxy-D-manno-octulosonic acid transferase [Sulfurimonas sp.]MCW8896356.1 lipid IV(A) 3-deoxy-D-manno-octulosonic acid transferase [Sulfurimonas sp.]MCW8953740.1 lipid IV(A) 3-deoxy-D-manno-octulosonic acid transferase [Sulfurimonas sp.]MCW9068317.1 lipid IV(A) 3-deoxy-D-manno-octulosonic acid transferase [Sulfurimonas sp.]
MKPFTLFYFILSVVLYAVALPLLVYLSFKQKYKKSIPARFFLFNNPKFKNSDGVWFHVCSYGEAGALKPIIKHLSNQNIMISTITQTGYAEAKKYDAEVRYLPYEMFLPFWAKKQKVLIVLEAEFWFLLFSVLRAKGARIILLNARIPDNSVKSYLQFSWFYKKLLSHVEVVYAQSETDKNRFLALGARNIEVIGNIKLAGEIKKTKEYKKPDVELIVAGSTHPTEEESVLKSFVEYRKQSDAKLVIVPRHPERFEDVYKLMQAYANKADLTLGRFSTSKEFETDMILLDAMGELNNIYAISDIAILGGAFKPDVGGHNPLEPAFFGCKIITGKHFPHQKELFKYVHHVQYVEPDEIHKALMTCRDLPPSMVEEKIDLQAVIKKILEV